MGINRLYTARIEQAVFLFDKSIPESTLSDTAVWFSDTVKTLVHYLKIKNSWEG